MKPKILAIGEPMLDTTVPVRLPANPRSLLRRSDSIVYEQYQAPVSTLGGVFYAARALRAMGIMDLSVVYPMPTAGFNIAELTDQLAALNRKGEIVSTPVPVDRRLYEAVRYLEADRFDARPGRCPQGLFRIDSGDSHWLTSAESKRVLDSAREAIRRWTYEGWPSCVLLADYDLGLFSPAFVSELGRILPSKVPVVVYAGRTWRKFTSLANCGIVSDYAEGLADLVSENDVADEQLALTHPFPEIAMRFPNLRWMSFVDRNHTYAAHWDGLAQGGDLVGQRYEVQARVASQRVPIGRRALVACALAIEMTEAGRDDAPNGEWLERAERLACFHQAVLTARAPSGMEAEAERNVSLGRAVHTATFNVARADLLRHVLLQRNLVLDLSAARTLVPPIVSVNQEYQRRLATALSYLQEESPTSWFGTPRQFLRSLLITGASGEGKSAVAKALALECKGDGAGIRTIACNEERYVNRPEEVLAAIRSAIVEPAVKVVIVDEVDKMPNGHVAHGLLLQLFERPEPAPHAGEWGALTRVILVCTRPVRMMPEPDDSNLPDLYNRLPVRLEVPAIDARPLDAPYVFAETLFRTGVRRVSLTGFIAVSEKKFTESRQAAKLAERVAESGRRRGSDVPLEAFEGCNLALSHDGDGSFVTIIG